jgi:hypothetical protein
VKSLVNDDAEMLGVGPDAAAELLAAVDVPAALDELDEELELEDELPQADTATLAVIASTAMPLLLLSKCKIISSSVRNNGIGPR